MGVGLISILLEAYNNSMKFADGIVSKLDEKKYAEAVVQLYGREPTYEELDAAIEIIKTDTTMPTKEKIEILQMLSSQRNEYRDKEFEKKMKCAETIDESNRKKGEVAVKVAMGVMTGGVSLLPDALNSAMGVKPDNDQNTQNNPG